MGLIKTLLVVAAIGTLGAFAESQYHFFDKLSMRKPVAPGYVSQLTTVDYEKNKEGKLEVYLKTGSQKLPIFENEDGKIMVGGIDYIVNNADSKEIVELFKGSGIRIKKKMGSIKLSEYVKDIYISP